MSQRPLDAPHSPGDQPLLDRAREWLEARGRIVTAETLQDLSEGQGIDLATAVLYQQLRSESRNQPLIRELEASSAVPENAQQQQTGEPREPESRSTTTRNDSTATPRIVIIPGAFHAQYTHTGANGQRIRDLAATLGWPCESVPIPSLSSMRDNAESVIHYLTRSASAKTILVSLSKGGADVRTAMAHPRAAEAFASVSAWVNLSGLVHGTPLVGWLRARPLRCMGVRLLLRLRGQRFSAIDELRHDAALASPFTLPAHIRAIHVLGFPLTHHLTNNWARRGHARLTPLGPNDGGGILLADALRLLGEVYPIWGADHYLRPNWDVQPLLLRILQAVAQR